MSVGERDIWAEAQRTAAQWFARAGAGPSTPQTEWTDRFAVAIAAAQAFAEQYRQRGEPLSKPDARMLATRLHECLRPGVEFNPARTLDETIKRAMDPHRKDRVLCRDALDARIEDCIREGRPMPSGLRQWLKVRDARPKHMRDSPNRVRDAWIVRTLLVLRECGIPPTRNRDEKWIARAHGWEGSPDPDYKPLAGCTIVAGVLGIKNYVVEKSWGARDRVL